MQLNYDKTFLSGTLVGLTVPCGFPCPDMRHAKRARTALERFTEDSPGSDTMTGALFTVSNVRIKP